MKAISPPYFHGGAGKHHLPASRRNGSGCKQNLARFKPPKQVVFGELPKTATFKIQKYKLREQEWGDRKSRVV